MSFLAEPPSSVVRGALWMVLSCAILSLLAGLVRYLSSLDIHPFQIVFCRLFFAFACFMPWIARRGVGHLRTGQTKLYGLRSIVSMAAMTTWFFAVSLIPIGEVTALSFLSPLFMTVGAALVLGETVRLRRWTATVIGFLGALVIIRPGMMEMGDGQWLALASAVLMGTSSLVIKTLTRFDSATKVVFYSHLFMTPIGLVPALFVWEWPEPWAWLWLAAMGPIAVLGHISLTKAFSMADASAIAPFDFARLPFAVLVGWFAFGEVTDLWTWVGAAIIFTSSVYIARREAVLSRAKPARDMP